mmetsp:Transcript_8838/g.15558  ORF Transcript_8838/g.15558 Transcript_8838/m.15558 type:complete len:109 (-) Transcript_8838:137-463(-)
MPPMQQYEVHTKVSAIDEKWMFMRQNFIRPATEKKPAKVYSEATIKAMISSAKGPLPPKELIRLLGLPDSIGIELSSEERIERYDVFKQVDGLAHVDAKNYFSPENKQ